MAHGGRAEEGDREFGERAGIDFGIGSTCNRNQNRIRSFAVDTPGKRDKSKDHPEGLPVRPGTPPLACPFREIQVAGYAHLHTTLNKSRDEKLYRRRVGRGSDSGGRAGVMVWRMAGGRGTVDSPIGKKAPPPGLEPGTYRLTAERSAN